MSCLQVLNIMHDDDDILEVAPPPSSPQLSYNEVKWFALMPNRRKCEMLVVKAGREERQISLVISSEVCGENRN